MRPTIVRPRHAGNIQCVMGVSPAQGQPQGAPVIALKIVLAMAAIGGTQAIWPTLLAPLERY
ncbi:MAG: hypothetical protein U1E51_04535 [Candidatus Binatia bacterium]|nr:hypothetical protein [Candidatus Binatia bacterium]